MKGYSNIELAFRIIMTFIEGFVASFLVLGADKDLSEKPIRQSVVLGAVASGISAMVNFIKLIMDDNKRLMHENNNLKVNNSNEIVKNELPNNIE